MTVLAASAILAIAQERAALAPGENRPVLPTPSSRALVSDKEVASLVEDRVQRWQPVGRERRMDQVGWAKDIRHALRWARENDRPIFLFTHDGRVNIGRC